MRSTALVWAPRVSTVPSRLASPAPIKAARTSKGSSVTVERSRVFSLMVVLWMTQTVPPFHTEIKPPSLLSGMFSAVYSPRALSGGQRQRVAIGRAMVRNSKVFLMDEPLSNLDAKLRNQMRAEIILLRQKLDTTFVYVTHDQTEAMTLGDRIVIMKDGVIMQVGTPAQVFEMPENLFAAEFIGAPKMNIVRTQLTKEGGQYFVSPFGVKLPVDGVKGQMLADKAAAPGEVILGVRPEHIVLAKDGEPSIPCTLEVNEMMGSELHLHVYTEDGTRLIVRIPTIDLENEERRELVAGKKLNITFKGKVMHFFDPESEKNLLI